MINDQASLVPRKIDNSLLFSADFSNGAVPLIIVSAVKHDVREAFVVFLILKMRPLFRSEKTVLLPLTGYRPVTYSSTIQYYTTLCLKKRATLLWR